MSFFFYCSKKVFMHLIFSERCIVIENLTQLIIEPNWMVSLEPLLP